MKDKLFNNKNKLVLLVSLLLILILFYIVLIIINYKSVDKYENVILPNIYIEEFDMGGYSYENSYKKIEFYNDYILSRKIKFVINNKDYSYTLNELGFTIDKEKTIQNIKDYQKSLSIIKKSRIMNSTKKCKEFSFVYNHDENKLKEYIKKIKDSVDVGVINGYFDTSDGVKYLKGNDGFSLDIDSSYSRIVSYIDDSKSIDKIELKGEIIPATYNENYTKIDTMTSSFVTSYDTWVTQRSKNLRVAVNYINGAIIEPGEIFSYYKYAGPYDKDGYVFYYEFVGNGVCQVATTTYNAALLGGLEIVKRYPHKKKSVYVDGGLDATVASYSSGWNVDMQWKNTYDYPIYVKAYDTWGEIHVEFWSNSDAKKGKSYSTESVWLGGRGYQTYLHTFQDGVEIDRSPIATTWYLED